jgi:hypothetical protein
MKPEQWRPSNALRKRRTDYVSIIEVSGLASVMIFFLFLFMAKVVLDQIRLAGIGDVALITEELPRPSAP